MKTIILSREDINNPLHPFMWEQLCEELGVSLDSDTLTLKISNVESDVTND